MAGYDFYTDRKVTGISRRMNAGFARRMAAAIAGAVRPGDSVLELGSGDGPVARLLHDKFKYSGYEPNPVLATRLEQQGFSVRRQPVPPLAEADESQNIVAAIHMLEHVADIRDARLLATEVRRVLKPQGYFFAVSPDFRDYGQVFYDGDYTHNFVTTPHRVMQLLVDAGFEIVSRKFVYGPFYAFPGIFFNTANKFASFAINCARDLLGIDNFRLVKMQLTFSRGSAVLARKR